MEIIGIDIDIDMDTQIKRERETEGRETAERLLCEIFAPRRGVATAATYGVAAFATCAVT